MTFYEIIKLEIVLWHEHTTCVILFHHNGEEFHKKDPDMSATQKFIPVVYAVPGVANQAVRDHLEDIRDNIMLFAQEAEVKLL